MTPVRLSKGSHGKASDLLESLDLGTPVGIRQAILRLSALVTDGTEPSACSVPGCRGMLIHTTNGQGVPVSYCEACEHRCRREQLGVVPRPPAERPAAAPAPAATPVHPPAGGWTLEGLIAEVDRRFVSATRALSEYKVAGRSLQGACDAGAVRFWRINKHCVLLERESLAAWCNARERRSARREYTQYLPRSRAGALTAKELAQRTPISGKDWSLWFGRMVWEEVPHLRRVNVSRDARPTYAYWWEGA